MVEIFLFINPIGIYCYDLEEKIQKTIKKLSIDASYHFVPITSVGIVQEDMCRRRLLAKKQADFSYYTLTIDQALKDYHAIKIIYGNKKARKFLLTLQKQINEGHYSPDLNPVQASIEELNLNVREIQNMLKSEFIQNSLFQDQKLAQQWHIKTTPTTVIFDEDDASKNGILLEGLVEEKDLISIFDNQCPLAANNYSKVQAPNHLRLI